MTARHRQCERNRETYRADSGRGCSGMATPADRTFDFTGLRCGAGYGRHTPAVREWTVGGRQERKINNGRQLQRVLREMQGQTRLRRGHRGNQRAPDGEGNLPGLRHQDEPDPGQSLTSLPGAAGRRRRPGTGCRPYVARNGQRPSTQRLPGTLPVTVMTAGPGVTRSARVARDPGTGTARRPGPCRGDRRRVPWRKGGSGRVSQSWGRPLRLSHADIVRWRAQLLVTGTCHVWMGAVGSDGYGRIPAGATVLHDCEVRLCCRAAPGHLRVGTQSENMRQAVARGRAVGPHPGRVDVRGKAGASRAIQAALRAVTDRSPAALAAVLASVIAEGDPLRDLHPLFDLPAHPDGASVPAVVAFPGAGAPGGVLVRAGRRGPVESFPLFGG